MEMNILKELMNRTQKNSKLTSMSLLGDKEVFIFDWNDPVDIELIHKFEKESNYILPTDYKKFLMISNGATIFKSEYEDDGYRLLGINEISKITKDMIESGYDINDSWYCFMQCLFSDDVILFDLSKEKNNIIDGDVGYPSNEWDYINMDFTTFITRLYQCNGAMFWRW